MSDFDREFGAFVRARRIARRWTQQTLAEKLTERGLRVGRAKVSLIESGAKRLRVSEAQIIARLLGGRLIFDIPECEQCGNKPPEGYHCNTCGRSS